MTDDGPEQTAWAPPTAGIIGCAGVGALLAAVGVMATTDVPGRLLGTVAGLGLLMFAAMSWRTRPKLSITAAGLQVRGWWHTRVLTRADLTRIRITEFRRIGRTQRLLEIETSDEQLILLSRWDLGVEPLHVLDALTTAGYAGR